MVVENLSKLKAFYIQGNNFAQCAERSMGEMNEDGSIQLVGGRYGMLCPPVMVNAAFACEMFLKGILIAHGIDYKKLLKQRKGHGLKALYDLLPKEKYKEFLKIPGKEQDQSDFYKFCWLNRSDHWKNQPSGRSTGSPSHKKYCSQKHHAGSINQNM